MPNLEEKIGNARGEIDRELIPGSFDDDAVTRGLLGEAIRRCEQSREQIAERMSWLLSKNVTASMLNDFTAESKANHRFPFAWARAFCESTGDWRLFHHIMGAAGYALLNKQDADVLTLGELVIEQERTKSEIARHARNIIERRVQP